MRTILPIMIITLAFVGCGKNELPTTTANGMAKTSNYRSWYDNGGDDYGCKDSGGTCLGDVVVNGNDKIIIDHVFDVIATGVQSDIKATFSKNRTVLERYIPKDTVADVIAGNLEVSSKGKLDDALRYMLFMTPGQNGTLKSVVPFKS